MFGEEYKNGMNEIQPDEEVRKKVLGNVLLAKNKKHPKMVRIFKSAAAVAACCAIAVSVWVVTERNKNGSVEIAGNDSNTSTPSVSENNDSGKENNSKVQSTGSDKKVNTAKKNSYAKIYKAVKNTYDNYEVVKPGTTHSMGISQGTLNKGSGSAATNGEKYDGDAPVADSSYSAQSETVNQVEGVDEADIVKTDGKYMYCLWSKKSQLKVIKVGENAKFIGSFSVAEKNFVFLEDMYLVGDRLVLLGNDDLDSKNTKAIIYDVSNPKKPKKLFECVQSGDYSDSRMIGDKLYLISDYSLLGNAINSKKPETYVPVVDCKNYEGAVSADSIFIGESCTRLRYTLICGFSVKDGKLKGTQSFFGGTYTVYCSQNNIITAGYQKNDTTQLVRYSINDGKIEFESQGEIKGELLNQFSIDEYKGYFRFVTTARETVTSTYDVDGTPVTSVSTKTTNALVILKPDLKQKSAIRNIAPNESVYSVRFMGDVAYFVTFRQVDPLFSVDVSDPAKPKLIGALKIPGFSNYLFPFGDGKLLGIGKGAYGDSISTNNLKLSMFDVSDPANVTESSKTVLAESYSSALDTHKATFVNSKKRLIALSVYDYDLGSRYIVFKYQGGKFIRKAEIMLNSDNSYEAPARGLNIGDDLYVYAGEMVYVFDTEDFSVKKAIDIR